jgi:PII-like signaling protein
LSSDDILTFSSLLDLSVDLPITISMLQANPIIAKNIKSIGKMKASSSNNTEEPYISSLQKLSSSASEVVKAWKSRIVVED